MALIVSDANIFIDMEVGGLTPLMFQIGEEIAVPDILYEEELREHHSELPGYGLRILEVQEMFVKEADRMGAIHIRAGRNDLLALALAKQERCPLLTGDGALRSAAEAEGVLVRGTLWLVEKMLVNNLLDHAGAIAAYDRMRDEGRRTETQTQISGIH